MLKFNVGDRVGTVVIERGSAGNAFTGEMIRQLGEIMHLAAEQADIVTLAGIGADFTVGRDRQEPKSGSPFDAFRNISALNKAIAELPGVLITGVRGRAFGLGVGHRRVVLACKRYLRAVGKMPPEVRSAYALVEQTQFAMDQSE